MNRSYFRCLAAIGLSASVFLMLSVGCFSEGKKHFEIVSGPADLTLLTFSNQADIEIVFDSESVSNTRTRSVSGTMKPQKALDVMLSGTKLIYSVDSEGHVYAVKVNPENGSQRSSKLENPKPSI